MEHPAFGFLGYNVTDKVTGLTGYVAGIVKKSNGMVQCTVQPKGDGSTYPEPWAFDHDNLVINEEVDRLKVTPITTTPYGLLTEVKHLLTGVAGKVSEISWNVNGCLTYGVMNQDKDGGMRSHHMFHETMEVVKAPEHIPPVKRSGGPATRAQRL